MNKLNQQQVLQIPELIKRGTKISEIANEFEVSIPAIWYWIRKLRDRGVEIKTNKPGRRPLFKNEDAVSLKN